MATLSLSQQEIQALTPDEVNQLAERLEKDDYNNPFEALQDWHLLRAISFHNWELVEPYRYLLDVETFDEA
ncbi:Protein of unknown function DUF2555 [Halothece sp. PCC 7418]|uniref:protein IsiD n=1 Tax=Halothece sp. (strain PCC 7418) TaxID=65093 RepID=UPI0002A06B1B|nr:DUF2555 domain-containing protein [Halothece sp. PCC 7418]AFZ43815.1 Protein of unknown function DUF2555 [Halothece sp. PCC 7418]